MENLDLLHLQKRQSKRKTNGKQVQEKPNQPEQNKPK